MYYARATAVLPRSAHAAIALASASSLGRRMGEQLGPSVLLRLATEIASSVNWSKERPEHQLMLLELGLACARARRLDDARQYVEGSQSLNERSELPPSLRSMETVLVRHVLATMLAAEQLGGEMGEAATELAAVAHAWRDLGCSARCREATREIELLSRGEQGGSPPTGVTEGEETLSIVRLPRNKRAVFDALVQYMTPERIASTSGYSRAYIRRQASELYAAFGVEGHIQLLERINNGRVVVLFE